MQNLDSNLNLAAMIKESLLEDKSSPSPKSYLTTNLLLLENEFVPRRIINEERGRGGETTHDVMSFTYKVAAPFDEKDCFKDIFASFDEGDGILVLLNRLHHHPHLHPHPHRPHPHPYPYNRVFAAVGIFPEGTSHDRTTLLKLKTGAARIALGYEKPIAIVPVGLMFAARDKFGSDAVVQYGYA